MPYLQGLSSAVVFSENASNAYYQLLDSEVIFRSSSNNFLGGRLTVSGLLSEDFVSVRNQGTGTGQIGLAGTTITFSGMAIGTLVGGAGQTLTVNFNSAATTVAIDALIQNLVYANNSQSPSQSRNLLINVSDGLGSDLISNPNFAQIIGANNPFNGGDVGFRSTASFGDFDADGDIDFIFGNSDGITGALQNTGNRTSSIYQTDTYASEDLGYNTAPALVDIDGDGDLDGFVGTGAGFIYFYRNTGTASVAVETLIQGIGNPANSIVVGFDVAPSFCDIDGDGDYDLFVGELDGNINYFENTGTRFSATFVQRTGISNPFNGVDVGGNSMPTFVDLDRDGDQDAIVGEADGTINFFENMGTSFVPNFVQRIGSANPFSFIDVGNNSAPAFADIDGDHDDDLIIGEYWGGALYFQNNSTHGHAINVTVNAQDEGIFGTENSDTLRGTTGGDFFHGLAGDDVIFGLDGDDLIRGGEGHDRIDGGDGYDTVTVSGSASSYRLFPNGDGFILKGPDGCDYLVNVDIIRFADGMAIELSRLYELGEDARFWSDGRIPESLLSGDSTGSERPLVLPGAAADDVFVAKDGGSPEVLPAVDDVVASAKLVYGPVVLPRAPSDEFSAEAPEVLPTVDDGFFITGKFDQLPPVMPTPLDETGSWDLPDGFRPSGEPLALILEGDEHTYSHSLTLLDERPTSPTKGDAWE